MKIGFPNHPRKNLIKEIGWIAKNGFDFIDLFLEEDKTTPEKINVGQVKRGLLKYKLGAVGHLAWYLPIGSSVKSLRTAACCEAVRYFKILNQLGVKFVTIHSNWPNALFFPKEGCNFQIESLRKLVKEAKKYDLELIYEPIDTPADTVENVAFVLEMTPGLSLHLDIGHANLCGRDPVEFINKFHRRIKHIHLHDNFGKTDQHLPLGDGSINFSKIISVLKKHYDGTITLEIFTKNKNKVLLSKEILKKLWNNA